MRDKNVRRFLKVLTSSKLDIWLFELKIDKLVTAVKGNVRANFVFLRFFAVELKARAGDRQDAHYGLSKRMHNN